MPLTCLVLVMAIGYVDYSYLNLLEMLAASSASVTMQDGTHEMA